MKVEDAVLLFYLPALPFSSMYSKIIIYSVLLQISSGHIQFAFGFACYSYSLAACLHDDTDAVFRAWTVLSIYFSWLPSNQDVGVVLLEIFVSFPLLLWRKFCNLRTDRTNRYCLTGLNIVLKTP